MAVPNTPTKANPRKRRASQADAMALTHEELRRRLSYEPETGIFRWISGPANRVGIVAGSVRSGEPDKEGRRRRIINIAGVLYRANRLAWFYMTGEWPAADVDHKDGDCQNDRWSNLRQATRTQNNVNTSKRPVGASGARGVLYDPRYRLPWKACASINNKTTVLGRFATRDEAIQARAAFNQRHYGEFARDG